MRWVAFPKHTPAPHWGKKEQGSLETWSRRLSWLTGFLNALFRINVKHVLNRYLYCYIGNVDSFAGLFFCVLFLLLLLIFYFLRACQIESGVVHQDCCFTGWNKNVVPDEGFYFHAGVSKWSAMKLMRQPKSMFISVKDAFAAMHSQHWFICP